MESYYYYLQEAENSSTASDKKNNYLIQAKIILKEKNMLKRNNSLNYNNLKIVDEVITNFIMSYIYDVFNCNNLLSKRQKALIYLLFINRNTLRYVYRKIKSWGG